jgi:hypothetical protein
MTITRRERTPVRGSSGLSAQGSFRNTGPGERALTGAEAGVDGVAMEVGIDEPLRPDEPRLRVGVVGDEIEASKPLAPRL